MRESSGIITLLSDFGSALGYVAQMKGVILGLNPRAWAVDIDHAVTAQNIACAALTLEQTAPYFPDGSVHLAVVDPGVGGSRRAVIVETGRAFFVGPDNGLFGFLRRAGQLRALYEIDAARLAPAGYSSTFHGRDIFAPAAARLALGQNPLDFARLCDDPPLELPQPENRADADSLEGRIVCADAFGNLLTSINQAELAAWAAARPGVPVFVAYKNLEIPLVKTFSDTPVGVFLACIGSGGRLEIAVNCGDARRQSQAREGEAVRLKFRQ